MAKVKIKGKNVTGTSGSDKITWLNKSAWNKALVVKAGKGNDTINFKKSKYANTLYGGNGNDTIYGGKGNDKIYGNKGKDIINAGKGKNTLYFAKGDGNDIIQNGGGTDTLVFTDEKLSNIKVAYSGDNAVIIYTNGKITLKDYKKVKHSAKYIQVGSVKKAISDYFKTTPVNPSTPDNPSGGEDKYNDVHREMMSHKLNGTDGKDWIVSDLRYDTIKAGAGDDYIELQEYDSYVDSGKGDDKIWALKASYTFNFNSGDGNDLIKYDSSSLSYTHFIFADENNIANLSFTLNEGTGFSVGYNGDEDSVTVVLPDNSYQDLVKEHNYKNVFSDYKDESYNIEMNNNKYQITAQGFAKINNIDPNANQVVATDDNDKIYISNDNNMITEVRAGAGDDYINAYSPEDNYINIYGGKGNDTIDGHSGSNICFENGDGNDVIYLSSYNTNLIFKDETSIDNLDITKENEKTVIKYNNNSDSVTLYNEDNDWNYVNLEVGDNKYALVNSEYWNEHSEENDIDSLLGTNGDDNITYSMYSENVHDTIILGTGNDKLRISDYYDNLGVYFNIDQSENISNDIIFFSYVSDGYYDDEDSWIENSAELCSSLKVKDYIQNSSTKTIYNEGREIFDFSKLDEIKSAVAGWLETNGYTDVLAAINDDTLGSENLATLLGSDYFGKLSWQENN